MHFGKFLAVAALVALSLGLPPRAAAADQALKDCMNLPDPDRNIIDCTTVIERGAAETPRNRAIAYLNRAIAYLQKRDMRRGLADLDAAVESDPTLVAAYYNRALFHHRNGDFERALADYDAVIRLDPTMINAYGNRATIHYTSGAFAFALRDYEAALALAPDNPDLIHSVGLVRLAMGDIAAAMPYFDRAVALAPRKMRHWLNRGRAHARQGNYELAWRDFSAAQEIARDHPEATTCAAVAKAALDAQKRGAKIAPLPQACVSDPAIRTARSHSGSRRAA